MELNHLLVQVKVTTASGFWPSNFMSLLFFFSTQHFIFDFVGFMSGIIRFEAANVKHDLHIPSLVPLRQHFMALGLMLRIIPPLNPS